MNKASTTLVLLCVAALVSSPAGAEASTWAVTNGGWSGGGNWTGGEPVAGTTAYINNGGGATITNAGEVSNYLYVASGAANSGSVQINSGDLTIGVHEFIGQSGVGSVTQSNGTHTVVSQLYLGGSFNGSGGTGTYTLSGGLLDVDYKLNVGYNGTGYFYHSGGTCDAEDDDLYVGYASDSNGNYQLSGTGQLLAGDLEIGYRGTGEFTQSAGTTNTLDDGLNLGNYAEGDGSYTLAGGDLLAWKEVIGDYGTGTFTQTGGTNTVKTSLTVGYGNGSNGTYNFKGGTLKRYDTWFINLVVGDSSGASGTFQGWGTIDFGGGLYNSGRIIADGYGIERTLDASNFNSSIYNWYENPTTNGVKGWFAVNKGRLELPVVSVATGNSTVNWGERNTDTTIDLVNSVRLAFSNVTSGGDFSISLLDGSRSDAAVPGGWDVMAVWDFQPPAGFSFDSVDLTFRYDDAMAAALGLNESTLSLFHYEGGQWVDIVTSVDTVNKLIHANGVTSFSTFAVGVTPEPATLTLLALGGLAVLRRRRRH